MGLLDNVFYCDSLQHAGLPVSSGVSTSGATCAATGCYVPAGATILIACSETLATASGTISDGVNTYSTLTSGAFGGSSTGFGTVFVSQSVSALTNATITFTKQTTGHDASIVVIAVVGIGVIDSAVTSSGTVSAGTTVSAVGGTPTVDGDVYFGVTCINANNSMTPPTSFTSLQIGTTSTGCNVAWANNVGGLAPFTFTSTFSSASGIAFVFAFKVPSRAGWAAVPGWKASNTQHCGDIIRNNLPVLNSERCFVCFNSVGGTGITGAGEPAWVLTRGGGVIDNTNVRWQECSGVAALNGDLTNTPTWAQLKAATASATLGQVIQNNAGTKILICTVAGTISASEPAWAAYTTAGATTTDTSATWVTLAAVPSGFSSWAAPHARMKNSYASSWAQAGNNVLLASEHFEIQNATNSPISTGLVTTKPVRVICVDKTNVPPGSSDYTTGATIATTVNGTINLNFGGNEATNYFGIDFIAGYGTNAGGNPSITLADGPTNYADYRSCTFSLQQLLSGATIGPITSSSKVICESCAFTFNHIGQGLEMDGDFRVFGGSVAATGVVPTDMLLTFLTVGLTVFDGVDLSNITTLTKPSVNMGMVQFRNCKTKSGVVPIDTGSTIENWNQVDIIHSGSSGNTYTNERHNGLGDETTETTVTRTGGANVHGTLISRKIVTTSRVQWDVPFQTIPLAINNQTVGSSVTLTVYGIWGGGAVPTNDQVWIEVSYPGTSGNPISSIATTGKANILATGSNSGMSDSSSWGGSTTPFKMAATFTPELIGPLEVAVKIGAASQTFYIDPKPVLS